MLKYLNGTIVSTSFVLSLAGIFPVIFTLDLNNSETYHLAHKLVMRSYLFSSSVVVIWLIFVTLP